MASNELIWHPGAISDVEIGRDWYAERSPRAAHGFLLALETAVNAVMEAPDRWPKYRHGCRRHVFPNRYPYSLIYRPAENLEIIAVAHDKRRPGYWRRRMLALVLLLGGAALQAAAAAPPPPGEPCWYSTAKEGMAEHADCLRLGKDGRPYVDPRRAREMELEAYGLAAVHGERLGWMYVDRRGKVVIAGVAVFDNWADPWKNGRVRIHRGDKWGFADRRGREVIPPIYDGALPFEKGKARVCRGCRQACADPGCEIHLFAGGEWLCIDPRGRPAAGCTE